MKLKEAVEKKIIKVGYPTTQDGETIWDLLECKTGSKVMSIVTNHQERQKMIDENNQTELNFLITTLQEIGGIML